MSLFSVCALLAGLNVRWGTVGVAVNVGTSQIVLIRNVFLLEMAGGKKACTNFWLDKFGSQVLQL